MGAPADRSNDDAEFRAVNAIRDAIPTRAHAEMLVAQVADLLGDAAWVETAGGGQSQTLFRRESPGSPWIVPWPLISVARGGREGPSPILTAIPGVYAEPEVRPGPAPKIRGLGPGQLTIHDGAHSVTVCYGADGRWFECSVTDARVTLAGVVPVLASRSASPVELVAAFVAGIDPGRQGPARVHLPVPLPWGAAGVWGCALGAIRALLFQDQVPADGRFVAADGWTGRAIAFGPTRDAAVAAWRAEVERVRPFPAPAPETGMPAFEMPDPPPESHVEQEFDGKHLHIRGVFFGGGPTSDASSVEPTLANSPVAVIPVAELPDAAPAFGAWVRTVDRWGRLRLAGLRRERRAWTLVGDAAMGQNLTDLDARLDAADLAWDAWIAALPPRPKFELPPGFPEPPPTDTSVRTYRVAHEPTGAPVEAVCSSAGRTAGYDPRSLDAERLPWQVVRMRRDGA